MAIGRTNCVGGGSAATVDLPTHPESISAASNNQKVIISLTYSDTDYISGVEVRYKTDGYPTSPTDGEGMTADGAATSIAIDGLINNTKYYFRVYLYREVGGVKYYQTDDTNATAIGIPTVVGIDGITPAIIAENYLLIDQSGTFTMTVPDGVSVTAHIVGGGGNGNAGSSAQGGRGGNGGRYLSTTLGNGDGINCTATVGAIAANTSLVFGSTTYSSANGTLKSGGTATKNGTDGWSTPYGYVGSSGGGGGTVGESGGYGGDGAGNGGSGGAYDDGSPGENAYRYGCGGGGGGEAWDSDYSGGAGGSGMKGCIIIAWN
ncbi:MAG: hypothetical protein ACI4JS_11485 [Oscillospiraceae bacterium]